MIYEIWHVPSGNMIAEHQSLEEVANLVMRLVGELEQFLFLGFRTDYTGLEIVNLLHGEGFITDEQRMELTL